MPDANNSVEAFRAALVDEFDVLAVLTDNPDESLRDEDPEPVHIAVGVDRTYGHVAVVYSDSQWLRGLGLAPGAYSMTADEADQLAKALVRASAEARTVRRGGE